MPAGWRLAVGILGLLLLAGCGLPGGRDGFRAGKNASVSQGAEQVAEQPIKQDLASTNGSSRKAPPAGELAVRRRTPGKVVLRYTVGPGGQLEFWADNATVVTVVVPGEADLISGEGRLRQWAEGKEDPLLAANLLAEGRQERKPDFAQSYIIIPVGTLRVGVIGLLAPQVDLAAGPQLLEGLRSPYPGLAVTDPVQAAAKLIPEVAGAADLVVVLSDLGPEADRAMVRQVAGIDLVLGRTQTPGVYSRQYSGKTPRDARPDRNAPVVEQTRNSFLMWVGGEKTSYARVELTIGETGVTEVQGRYLPQAPPASQAPQASRTPQTPQVQTGRPAPEKLGEALVEMVYEPAQVSSGETVLGNFAADAVRSYTGADIAMLEARDLRAGLARGVIIPADLQRLVPGGGEVVVAEVRGAVVKELLERGVAGYPSRPVDPGTPPGSGKPAELDGSQLPGTPAFPQFSGMNVYFDFHRSAGNRVVAVEIGGRLLDPLAHYRIAALHSLLARSERQGDPVRYLIRYHRSLAQVLREWTTAQRKVGAAVDGRVRTGSYTVIDVVATGGLRGGLAARRYPWSGGRELGGLPLLGGNITEIREQNPRGTILVDAGDLLAGDAGNDLFQGEAMVEALNTLGFTAAAIGEDDLEWGEAVFEARAVRARFSFLAANLYERATGLPVKWAAPTKMVTAGGRKIGLVGATLPSAPEAIRPEILSAIDFRPVVPAVNAEAAKLRKAGAEIVVVIAHVPGKVEDLAKDLRGVDLVVAAPSGRTAPGGYTAVAHRVPVMAPGQGGSSLARTRLLWDKDAGKVGWHGMQLVEAAPGRTDPDAAMVDLAGRYALRTRVRLAQIVGTSAVPLERDPQGESNLGNVVTDAYREATGAEVALQPGEGLKGDLPAGPVTLGDLFALLPAREHLILMEISGARLEQAVAQMVRSRQEVVQISGIELLVAGTGKGKQVLEVRSGGKPLAPGRIYRVAMPATLALDPRIGAFSGARNRTDTFVRAADALARWFESHKEAEGGLEGRIRQK